MNKNGKMVVVYYRIIVVYHPLGSTLRFYDIWGSFRVVLSLLLRSFPLLLLLQSWKLAGKSF